jgi:biotin carboxyl carrier protein
MKTSYLITIEDKQRPVVVKEGQKGIYTVMVGQEQIIVDALKVGPREYHLLHQDQGGSFLVDGEQPELIVHSNGLSTEIELLNERQAARRAASRGGGAKNADGTYWVTSPMPGKVVKRLVAEGEEVSEGQGVIVVEAMKMENELRSTATGTVKAIKVNEGDNVDAGECLVTIE